MTLVISTGGIAKTPLGARPGTLAAIIAEWTAAGAAGFVFDFTRMDGLYQDRAGTIPVTAIGQPVGYARDLSGKGLNAIAEDDAARPLMAEDSDGVLCIDCGTRERRLVVTFPSSMSFSTRSILTAASYNTDNNFAIRSDQGGASNNVASLGIAAAGAGSTANLGGFYGTAGLAGPGRRILSGYTAAGTPGENTIRINGVVDKTDTASDVVAGSTLGAVIGGRPSSAMNGLIYGVAWRAGDADLDACEQYFAERTGIALT